MSEQLDRQLEAARAEVMRQATVPVLWAPRGGGIAGAGMVRVLWPGSREPAQVSDGELAALRRTELDGRVAVAWPWNALRPDQEHAPIADRVEVAARLLDSTA